MRCDDNTKALMDEVLADLKAENRELREIRETDPIKYRSGTILWLKKFGGYGRIRASLANEDRNDLIRERNFGAFDGNEIPVNGRRLPPPPPTKRLKRKVKGK